MRNLSPQTRQKLAILLKTRGPTAPGQAPISKVNMAPNLTGQASPNLGMPPAIGNGLKAPLPPAPFASPVPAPLAGSPAAPMPLSVNTMNQPQRFRNLRQKLGGI